MSQITRKYQSAALLMLVSAALHLPVAALHRAAFDWRMILVAAIVAALAVGVFQARRWVAYLGFLTMVFGVSGALGFALTSHGVVAALFWLIGCVDLLAALVLFAILWRSADTIGA